MFKEKAAAILITGLVLFISTSAMAQSMLGKTTVGDVPQSSAVVLSAEFSLDPEWMQDPTLYCMNLDRGRPQVSRKRLVLDKSLQELKWVAVHGPRREMLAEFLSSREGNDHTATDGQMARVGGTVDSWSEISAAQRKSGPSLLSFGGLTVSLIGPESAGR